MVENNDIKKNVSNVVNNHSAKNNSIVPPQLKKTYYFMFFSIMVVSFLFMFWVCNYTKYRETFQIMMMMGFSISLAEYFSRRFLKF